MSTTGGIKVFTGNANRALAEEICHYLSCDPGRALTERFSDGEYNFQIEENVRGSDIFIVQPTCPPTDANLMVVAPDTGGAERARAYAKRLNADLALCDKRREKANVAEVMNVVGNVQGRSCLIVDDMCDTGGSLTKVARALKEAGAERIHACFTHAVLSGRACDQLRQSDIEQMVITNTIPLRDQACELTNIKVLSIAPLLAKAIKSIHEETSVSSLFV